MQIVTKNCHGLGRSTGKNDDDNDATSLPEVCHNGKMESIADTSRCTKS